MSKSVRSAFPTLHEALESIALARLSPLVLDPETKGLLYDAHVALADAMNPLGDGDLSDRQLHLIETAACHLEGIRPISERHKAIAAWSEKFRAL